MNVKRVSGLVCEVIDTHKVRGGWWSVTTRCGKKLKHNTEWNPETKDPVTCFGCIAGGDDA